MGIGAERESPARGRSGRSVRSAGTTGCRLAPERDRVVAILPGGKKVGEEHHVAVLGNLGIGGLGEDRRSASRMGASLRSRVLDDRRRWFGDLLRRRTRMGCLLRKSCLLRNCVLLDLLVEIVANLFFVGFCAFFLFALRF